MPELPEVETMRRGVLGIVGTRVCDVYRPPCKLRAIAVSPRLPAFRRRVMDTTVQRIDRLGKRLIVWLSSDQAIVFEPRMTGLVLLADPPTLEHLRFGIDLQGAHFTRLWFWDRRGLGSVRLLSRRQIEQQLGPPRLGPDALAVNAKQLEQRLCHRRTPIKVALLDQSAIAGIGNLYASEILHVAGIHPRTVCQRLTRPWWQRLRDGMHAVLEEAIRYEGSTLADGTYRTALNNPGGYQNRHRVYNRAGQICPSCEQREIERIVQAQRSTYFCPACQRQIRQGGSQGKSGP